MKAVRAPLFELEAFDQLHAFLDKPFPLARVTDCAEASKCHLADALGSEFKYRLLITYSDLRAREICEDYAFYDRDVVFYPAKDLIFYRADIHAGEIVRSRLRCLRQILSGRPVTVVTTFSALMAPMAPLSVLKENRLRIDRNETVGEQGIAKRLVTMGYERCAQAEMPGQFSVRGDIIDIYDLTADNPYRIELWGDD
ncbi:MAG: transcription-repair coupling factor, partial [Butyrivibrio sp.]|nr:transcription-repair coupling factor [Butyrivibrio sp.]